MQRFLAVLLLVPLSTAARGEFNVVEATIADMQQAMASGRVTSRELVQQYLTRIALYDKKLNAVMAINPNALREAEERDRERAQGRLRGPLHGIPIALKDNIHTTDMPTTGGALAFEGFVPPYEATVVKSLRDAGAMIIAKTGMTELANWMAGPPTPMPAGYNPISGFGMNPYDPRRDPRDRNFDGRPVLLPGGSSSGIGTAANFWAANVGTETSGSLLNPANQTMLVAIKPTVGRISRHGIIPPTRTPRAPWRGPLPTQRSCSGRWRMPSRTCRTRSRLVSRRRNATIRGFSIATRSRAHASAFRAPSTTSASRRPALRSRAAD